MTAPRAAVANASDRKQVKGAGKREKLVERRHLIDLATVMSSTEGRRFVWWLLGECGISASVMRQGSEMSSYNAGKQDFGHALQARIIMTDPDAYLLMQAEAIAEQKIEVAARPDEEIATETTDEDDSE